MAPPDGANWDGIGIFWVALASAWTALLIGGMVFLYTRRNMSILRIRGLSLSFGAVFLLHLYWLAVQTGYVYGHLMPKGVEFWIMGIYLPFGVALFHASNSRFLHVAKAQKKYVTVGHGKRPAARTSKLPFVDKFKGYDYTTKMLTIVSIGMGFQFFLTLIMYLVSRKFHPEFGIPGTEVTGTPEERHTEQGRGWEWWPSIFWQVFWAWVVAPIILWQSRGIHDTQGWRLQTIACCLASLHAAPMWIIALNVDAMGVINQYFIPPQWIAVSIMIIETFTIFVPCWQVLRHQSLRQETLELIALWETNKKNGGAGKSFVSGSTGSTKIGGSDNFAQWKQMGLAEKGASFDTATAAGAGLLTMDALEYALKRNPEPLQHFSALKDFSGENIAFLTSVSKWKTMMRAENVPASPTIDRSLAISPAGSDTNQQQQDKIREHFNQALRIYTDFISQRDAEFSINISSSDLRKLEAVFEGPARVIYGDRPASPPSATPFDDWGAPRKGSINGSEKGIVNSESFPMDSASDSASTIADKVYYWGEIPEGFDETIFDDAETSIKYLVLTNTWPKFVKDRRNSFDSVESNESYDTLIDMVVKRSQNGN